MANSKMHFEQIPVAAVLKIAKADIPEEAEMSQSGDQDDEDISGKVPTDVQGGDHGTEF
jgi:hypothetical protein